MEICDQDMGTAPPARILPAGVPNDAEPITEDQMERLPDYVQYLISEYMKVEREPRTTPEELLQIREAYFAGAAAQASTSAAAEFSSNSTECQTCVESNTMETEEE
jgi:hypothetical protein